MLLTQPVYTKVKRALARLQGVGALVAAGKGKGGLLSLLHRVSASADSGGGGGEGRGGGGDGGFVKSVSRGGSRVPPAWGGSDAGGGGQ